MILEERIKNYIFSKYEKIKINSNEIKKGDIFLALQGEKYHGNKFIVSAFKNGAKFCITDKKENYPNNDVLYVKKIYEYLEQIALKKRDLFKSEIIGITGSAGKTTLKETLAFFLKKNTRFPFLLKVITTG